MAIVALSHAYIDTRFAISSTTFVTFVTLSQYSTYEYATLKFSTVVRLRLLGCWQQ
jgi:hypothetical protein